MFMHENVFPPVPPPPGLFESWMQCHPCLSTGWLLSAYPSLEVLRNRVKISGRDLRRRQRSRLKVRTEVPWEDFGDTAGCFCAQTTQNCLLDLIGL